MLDTQNQGPQRTACGSPMKLKAFEPSEWTKISNAYLSRIQQHIIESALTEA